MFFLPIGQHVECLHCLPMAHTASTDRRWRGCYPVVVRCAGAGAAQPRLFTPAGAGTALPAAGHCTGPGTPLPLTTRCPRTSFTLTGENIAQRTCTRLLWVPSISVSFYSPSVTRTPHTHYCGQWSPRHRHCGTLDGGWWTPFGTGNTPSRDNLPTCQLNTHTTFQTLSDY